MRRPGAVVAVLIAAGTLLWLVGVPQGDEDPGPAPRDAAGEARTATPSLELAGHVRRPDPTPPGPFDALVAGARSADEDERYEAVRALAKLHAKGKIPFATLVAWATLESPAAPEDGLLCWALSAIADDPAQARTFLPDILASALGASESRQEAVLRFVRAIDGVRAEDVPAVARLFEHDASTYGLKRGLVGALDDLGAAVLPAAPGLIDFAADVLRGRAVSAREAMDAGISVSWDHVEYDVERLLAGIGPAGVPLLRDRLQGAIAALAREPDPDGVNGVTSTAHSVDLLASALAAAGEEGVGVLIGLLDHGDPRVRRDVLWALDDVKGPHEVVRAAALAALTDETPAVRSKAAGILAKHGGASVPALLHALADRNQGVRKSAAASLQRLEVDASEALEPLLRMLAGGGDDFARLAAAEAIASLGVGALPALPQLVARTAHPDEWFRVHFAAAAAPLAQADPAAFVGLWSDAAPPERRGMMCVLEALLEAGKAADARFLALTRMAVADPDLYVRVHAARQLAQRGMSTHASLPVLSVLMQGFNAEDGHVRMIATEGLAAINTPALPLLPAMLERIVRDDLYRGGAGHTDRSEESALDEALRVLGPHDLPRMFALLDHETFNLSYAAEAAFREAGPRGYAWLESAWPGARLGQKRTALDLVSSAFYAKGARAVPGQEAARRLAGAALQDPDPEVRFHAAHALQRDPQSQVARMSALAALLDGVPLELARRAAGALSGLGPRAAPIAGALEQHRAHPDGDVRRIVVRLLRAIEDAK